MEAKTVVLAGDKNLLWTGLRTSLHAMVGVTVLDEPVVHPEAADAIEGRAPDIILISANLIGSPTLERVRAIREHWSSSRVVILATHFREEELLALVDLRPSAYLLWGDLDLSALLQCLITVTSCDVIVASSEIVRRWFDRTTLRQVHRDGSPSPVVLSERERMILRGLATGMTQAQIAGSAHLSVRTVKRTVAGLGRKLDAPSSFALGARARTLGLVSA